MNTNPATHLSNRTLPIAQSSGLPAPAPTAAGEDLVVAMASPKTALARPALPQPAPPAPRPTPRPAVPGTPQQWADALWYIGHVLGAGSLLSRVNLPTAAVLVIFGQALVIVSRPLGRIQARAPRPADDMV